MSKNHRFQNNNPVPLNNRQQITVARQFYSGPLLSPEHLQKYNEILPGAAERIIAMAENQSNHRQILEKSVIKTDNLKSLLGTIFAFIIVLCGFGFGGYLVVTDNIWLAAAVSLTPLTGVVSAFIYGTNRKTKTIEAKKEIEN